MYKTFSQIDQQAFNGKIASIITKVNGFGEDYTNSDWRPQWTPETAIEEITRLYSETYWISSFDTTNERNNDLREMKQTLVSEMVNLACSELKLKTKVAEKDKDGNITSWHIGMKPAYSYNKKADRNFVANKVVEYTHELPCEIIRDEYMTKIDEKKFDRYIDFVIGTLYKTDNDTNSKKFLKLWMIDTKMKRFYSPDDKFPKNPIWLSLWSEKHSIGKGYFVVALREQFKNLFNCKTKSVQFKDLTKQFKGFASSGAYICHIDENDRLEKGSSDPNTTKNLISEKYINAERKGVDNDEDYLNRMSFISTTNQRVNKKVMKDMEEDRRLGEIHIVDACVKFRNCSFPKKWIDDIARTMWECCPVDDSNLFGEVRTILLEDTRASANTEFNERLEKVAEQMRWGDYDNTFTFKMYRDKKLFRVKWNTDVKKAYDSIFGSIGGWGTFQEMAVNIGFLYVTWKDRKRGIKCYNLDFSKLQCDTNECQPIEDEHGVEEV